ncbi:hypothetical protein VZT92_003826 [Zoarces viviparus]|uniref:Uncharacterized protein n=1 Tax=Zoarces viviparus TaxID=48416 RepID=A0AAW1FWW9_ZOAVI
MDSDPVHTNSSTHLLFAARDHTSEEKPQTLKHEIGQWMQDRLRIASKTGRVSQQFMFYWRIRHRLKYTF